MSMAPSEAWPGPSWGKSCVHIDQLIHRYVESHYIDIFFMLTTPVRCSSAIERLKHCWSVGTLGTFLKCCVIYLIVATYFWHISPSAVVSFLLGWYMPEKCLTSPGIASDKWTFKSWQQLSCIFYFRLLWESKDPLCC